MQVFSSNNNLHGNIDPVGVWCHEQCRRRVGLPCQCHQDDACVRSHVGHRTDSHWSCSRLHQNSRHIITSVPSQNIPLWLPYLDYHLLNLSRVCCMYIARDHFWLCSSTNISLGSKHKTGFITIWVGQCFYWQVFCRNQINQLKKNIRNIENPYVTYINKLRYP